MKSTFIKHVPCPQLTTLVGCVTVWPSTSATTR